MNFFKIKNRGVVRIKNYFEQKFLLVKNFKVLILSL